MSAGMICAAQPESTEAGALVMRAGGNAVDGAIACALVAGVVDPMMTGLAGFGSCQIYPIYVTDELTRDGYTVARNANTFDVAAVHGIEVRPDGSLHGGADPGHDGMALAV